MEVATIGRDSIFGAAAALDDGQSLTSAVVILPGTASMLDAAGFLVALHRSVTFRAMLAQHEQALLAMTQQSAAYNESRSVEARLSRWLLRARSMRRRSAAADSGNPGAADRRATKRDFDRRSCAAASGNDPLQPRLHRYCQRGRSQRDGLRVLPRCQRASSAPAQGFALRPPRRWQAHAGMCATMRRATKRCRRMHLHANFPCQLSVQGSSFTSNTVHSRRRYRRPVVLP